MAEYEISPYVRAALADGVVYATRDHQTTGLLYELWELAKQVGRADMETPWTVSRNPFGSPHLFAGRYPDQIGSDEIRQLLYGELSAPSEPLFPAAGPTVPTDVSVGS